MASFAKQSLSVGGIQTSVLSAGQGEPVVFFHGAGTFTGFDFLLPLAERFKLYVPLHPGFGESADDPAIDGVMDYVLHYIELFDQLGLERDVRLMGHSLGGWLAAKFATQQGHRISRLVLVSPAGLRVPAHPTADLFTIRPEDLPSLLVANPAVLAKFFQGKPDPEVIVGRYRETTSLARVLWERNYDPKLERWLARAKMPTLVIWGDKDRLIPVEQADEWLKRLPNAKKAVVPGAGHLVLLETPDGVARAKSFLNGG